MGTTHYFKGSILANIFPIIADYWMVSWSQKGILIDVLWIRRFVVVLMASISDSVALVDPPPSFEDELQDIHRKLRDQKHHLLCLNEEGGHHFELMDKDIIQT